MLGTRPDTVDRENGYRVEIAKHKETRMEIEIMKLKHSLLENKSEALRMSLKRSERKTVSAMREFG